VCSVVQCVLVVSVERQKAGSETRQLT
jgi:hypothetical protein